MTILDVWTVQSNAKKDAKAGVDSCNDLISSRLGDRPVFDPARLDHKRIEEDIQLDPAIKDLEDEVKLLEDQQAHEPRLLPINLVLALCYGAEPLACASLMKSYGFENPEKFIFGVMLAAGVFAVTSIASRMTGHAKYMAYAVYTALVIAVAGSRLAERGDGSISSWPEAVVLMFLTVGPAILAEWCWRRRENAAKLSKQARNVRRRLGEMRGRRVSAQRFVDRVISAQRGWDNDATVIRSTYAKEHRRKVAIAGSAWHVRRAPGTN